MMPVSVIIPCYNRHDLVKDAIESVFFQSRKAEEIIIVDDASASPIKLDAYLPQVKIIRLKNNSGVSAARNAAAQCAKAKYLAFLDSDDLWLPQKLERQIPAMQESGLPVSHCNEFWFRKGRWVNQSKQHEKYGGNIFCKILDKCRVSPSSLLIEKDFFMRCGAFDESLRACEDYELCLRIACRTDVLYIPEKMIVKRAIAANSLSAGIKHIEAIRLEILDNFIKNADLNDAQKSCAMAELERKRAIVKADAASWRR